MYVSQVVSILIALICASIAYFYGQPGALPVTLLVIVLPLGCIWYGQEIGSFTGKPVQGEVRSESLIGTLVVFAGWVMLIAALLGLILFTRR